MSRINTNVNSMLAQRIRGQQTQSLNKSLERLSTGLAINRGADDPAGLIASEALRSEKEAITAAIGNAERADQVMNIAEGGLQEVNSLLLELQGLVGGSANEAGLSTEEKEANQLQIDSILQTIDRIASSTSFQGSKLLNGNFDFTISGQSTSISDFTINAAKLEHNTNTDVSVVVTKSAQHAGLVLSVATTSGFILSSSTEVFSIEIAGSLGSREFSFASGTSLAEAAKSINTFKATTGISATASGTNLYLKSEAFGSNEFVSVDVTNAGRQLGSIQQMSSNAENVLQTASLINLSSVTNPIRDAGQDVTAIINGVQATADGKVARLNTDFLDLSIELTTSGAQNADSLTAFTITGGGAKFNLGPKVNIGNQVSIGVGNVASRKLGNVSLGYLDDLGSGKTSNVVDGNLEDGQKIVDQAIKQISSMRGRIGAFQKNTVGATIRSLGVALENTAAAESSIRDTDFASETAELTRTQILVQASTNILAISNSAPNSVLSLLG